MHMFEACWSQWYSHHMAADLTICCHMAATGTQQCVAPPAMMDEVSLFNSVVRQVFTLASHVAVYKCQLAKAAFICGSRADQAHTNNRYGNAGLPPKYTMTIAGCQESPEHQTSTH